MRPEGYAQLLADLKQRIANARLQGPWQSIKS
jgi:hypothetical protein